MWTIVRNFIAIACLIVLCQHAFSQTRALVTLGSSTTAGLSASPIDSSWVNRINHYYKNQLGVLSNTYNLGVSGTTCYNAMPTGYIPPAGRPSPDPTRNVTQAVSLLSSLPTPANGVVIVNFPTNGYDNYSISEILTSLQTIYNTAVQAGHRCYVTTTQPRSDGNFALPAVKRKLAILKDSIIRRFGVDRTINFWDGMYNPADTTILPAYSAGDNVHFNNVGHRVLFQRVRDKNIFSLSPALGDYRSNMANGATGLWSTASIWQRYDGAAWVAATTAPTAASGTITIQSGHRVDMTTATTFDQVVVASGGSLYIYNATTPTIFTLNDGNGNDIDVNGNLFVSVNATLTGAGVIVNNAGGTFTVRNQGILAARATNNGTMNISGTGNFQNTTVTNNGTINQLDFTLNLNNNASLINNGLYNLTSTSNSWIASTSGTGSLINNTTGTIFKTQTTAYVEINAAVAFTNNGLVKGFSEYTVFSSTLVNNGTVAPGNTGAAALNINAYFVAGKSPTFALDISTTGAVAGTNYDQIRFTTSGGITNANVTNATLTVLDNAADPIGTTYTLLTFASGTITGPFRQVNLAPSLGNLVYTATAITVQKTSIGKHWVGSYLYQNNFTTSTELNEWQVVENNNNTGSWSLSPAGNSAILKMDDAGGAYALRLFHGTGGVPARYSLDKVNGVVEFHVLALTGGSQRFFLQAQEFQSNGTYITQQTILQPQSTAGFFTINLSNFTWNALTTQIRFIIGGENYSAQQGTIEFDYFKYTNTAQTWSNTANWSASAGGTGGASLPTASDIVYFDNARTANCVIDVPVTVGGIVVNTGYTGAIYQGANAVTVNNAATFGAGNFVGGTANITVGGAFTVSGAAFTSTSAILELRHNAAFTSGTFSHNNGTVRYNTINTTTQSITGTGQLYNNAEFVGMGRSYILNTTGSNSRVQGTLSFTGSGALTIMGGTIEARGDIAISNAATGGGGTATVLINGTATQNMTAPAIAGQGVLPKVTINKTSGTVVIPSVLSIAGDWTHTAGTVDCATNASTMVFGGTNLSVTAAALPFNNITVDGNTVTLASSLTVDGNVTIAGGTLAAGNNTINLRGNWVNNASFTTGTTGTVNFLGTNNTIAGSATTNFANVMVTGTLTSPAILNIAGNFTNDGDFISGTGTVRFNGTAAQTIAGSSTTLFNHIEITNTTAPVRIENSQSMKGILTLGSNAVLDADGSTNNGVFTLISTADNPVQDAAIAALPAGAQIQGNVTVQRYMSIEGPNDGRIYRYIASPVQQGTVADIQNEIPVTGSFTGASICKGCTATQSMFTYNEAVTGDMNGDGSADFNDGYLDFPADANTEVLQPGKGYSIFVRGNYLLSPVWDIRGVVNQGNVTPVSFPVSFTPSANAANDGWNLIGNPYPSAIDWNAAGWTKTNIDATIYIADNGGATLRYASWNGVTGTNGGSRYIAMGQAFWIKASAAPVLQANETIKAPTQSPVFFRTQAAEDLLRIKLVKGNLEDETVIHFREDATPEFDEHADAWKLNNATHNLSSLAASGQKLAINSMPQLTCDTRLELLVEDVVTGTYRLTFTNIPSFSADVSMTLQDHFLSESIPVTDSSSYTFHVTEAPASKGKRFSIVVHKTPLPVTIVREQGTLKINETGSVQWFLNQQPIEGATQPILKTDQSGSYSVQVTQGNCILSGELELSVMGIEGKAHGLKLYPQPVEDKLYIMADGVQAAGTILVTNVHGLTMASVPLSCRNNKCSATIAMDDYPAGVYIVTLETPTELVTSKVVKK